MILIQLFFQLDEGDRRVGAAVPGVFVPKTFRSQERIVPMGNFRSGDFSLTQTGNKSSQSWALSFSGTFLPGNESSGELSFPGPFVPRNFRSQDFSFPGTFVSLTILQGIGYERRQL